MTIDISHAERALPAPFESATVEDAMSPGVISCPPETPLRVVARMMATFNVHSVFVFEHRNEDDEDAQLWGIVSDLDLVAAARLDVDERTAGGSAVTPIVAVRTDARLAHAADLMAQHGVAHLAVVEPASGRPIGVISTLDIARAIAVERGVAETQASG
ncbi:MAG TPA: CBS domain-containing protein [Gaiellaceae bacterium]|jgi:CBS domain-containing protein